LVIALFLESLATVLFNSFQTLLLGQTEFKTRDRLREACLRMAQAAEPEFASMETEADLRALNEKLRAISRRVLADYQGVEGGFYLDARFDRFAGHSFPTGSDSGAPRDDNPPPKETEPILKQSRNSFWEDQDSVQPVGPSRVAIVTQPVGSNRPARQVTWTMFRLISPETLQAKFAGTKYQQVWLLAGSPWP